MANRWAKAFYGSRRMSRELKRRGFKVGRDKARSLMRILGVEAIYPPVLIFVLMIVNVISEYLGIITGLLASE